MKADAVTPVFDGPRDSPGAGFTGVIIVGMLWEALQWFVSLGEVIAVMVAILMAGLFIAMTAFWVLSRILGTLAGAPVEADPNEFETDSGLEAALVPNAPDDASLPPSCQPSFRG